MVTNSFAVSASWFYYWNALDNTLAQDNRKKNGEYVGEIVISVKVFGLLVRDRHQISLLKVGEFKRIKIPYVIFN